jgi:hypothetical protein
MEINNEIKKLQIYSSIVSGYKNVEILLTKNYDFNKLKEKIITNINNLDDLDDLDNNNDKKEMFKKSLNEFLNFIKRDAKLHTEDELLKILIDKSIIKLLKRITIYTLIALLLLKKITYIDKLKKLKTSIISTTEVSNKYDTLNNIIIEANNFDNFLFSIVLFKDDLSDIKDLKDFKKYKVKYEKFYYKKFEQKTLSKIFEYRYKIKNEIYDLFKFYFFVNLIIDSDKSLSKQSLSIQSLSKQSLSKQSDIDCDTDINLIWKNNSCYIDTLFVALFHFKNKYIKNLIESLEVIKYKNLNCLIKIGELIKKELLLIYHNINNKKNIDITQFRFLLNLYYDSFKDDVQQIPRLENLLLKQNDLNEFYNFLFKVIFSLSHNINYIENGIEKNEHNTILHYINPSDSNTQIKLNNYIPKFTERNYIKTLNEAEILYLRIAKNPNDNKSVIIDEYIQLGNDNCILQLKSIILFNGMDNAGHYTCLINCNETWYLYDDSKKGKKLEKIGNFNKIINEQKFNTKIYGLVYVKIDNLNGGKSSIKLLKKY